jgi:hypothetical protein
MVEINLKAKHYYLIAELLFGQAAYSSFAILEKIKNACTGVADDDTVAVEIDTDNFINVFRTLAQKPEGSFNQINTEMLDLLFPQIAAGVAAEAAIGETSPPTPTPWADVSVAITSIRTSNLSVINGLIQTGKSRLFY